MHRLVILGLLLCSVSPAAAWTRFVGDRYGTSVDIPDGFKAAPAPFNSDGRTFTATVGNAEIRVFASYDVQELGFPEPDGIAVTYRASGKDWAVFSGRTASRIVYQKMIKACPDGSLIHTLLIEYDASAQNRLGAAVERMARSFKGPCP